MSDSKRINELESALENVLRCGMIAKEGRLCKGCRDRGAYLLSQSTSAARRKRSVSKERAPTWFDGGFLDNGHCSFMWARNGAGACCRLPRGHEGAHIAELGTSQSETGQS